MDDNKEVTDFRKGGLIHKIVRTTARSMIKSNLRVSDLVEKIEHQILALTKQNADFFYKNGGSSGIAFPVGVNINNVVAHDTQLSQDDDRILRAGDVVKIDIGININGSIVDAAFTHIVTDDAGKTDNNHLYMPVLDAAKDAMYSAISISGPDQCLYEISEIVNEVISSYEVELGSYSIPISSVHNIGGHNIEAFKVHGNKLILSYPDKTLQQDYRMEEGEIYAIETYATTGYGNMTQNTSFDKISHFKQADGKLSNKILKTDIGKWIAGRNNMPF